MDTIFAPYRVCPLGAHIDHQKGIVQGFAIDRGVHLEYTPSSDGVVELESKNFPGMIRFRLDSIPDVKVGDWADHLRGAAIQLAHHHPFYVGLKGRIKGDPPLGGGLSSSAAVIIAFLKALAAVNGVTIQPRELITMAQAAENQYVGVRCGKLDQSCIVLSRANHLLVLDCQTDTYELLPWTGSPFSIGVFYSGLERSLATSDYNRRQDECREAACRLIANAHTAGLPVIPDHTGYDDHTDSDHTGNDKDGSGGGVLLRDVPVEIYEAYRSALPEKLARRADHFFGEMRRVKSGIAAWKAGDLNAYGSLIFDSGMSSIVNYECGCDELITLFHILQNTPGVLGARFSGAGFKGCCMALIEPTLADQVLATVQKEYLKTYPQLADRYEAYICSTADGVAAGQ